MGRSVRYGCAILGMCFGPIAMGQLSNLDNATLIDGLAKEGMSELLLHLVESEPSNDPVVDMQIRVAQQRVRFRTRSEQAAVHTDSVVAIRLAAEGRHAFDQMLEAMRLLISEHADHEQRPIWQTDLAEALLVDQMQGLHQYAAEFYGYGTVDTVQRQVYRDVSVESLVVAAEAEGRFFELQGLLPRDAPRHQRLVDTGMWMRMIDEYWKKRTVFYLAHAAYFVSQLPDNDPYYAQSRTVVGQRLEPVEERARLLELAASKLRRFVEDTADEAGVRFAAMVLLGRVMIAQGQSDQVIATLLEPVIEAQQGDLYDLLAHLAKAQVIGSKRPDAALQLIRELTEHPQVTNNPLLRLLITDAVHRLLLAQAQDAATQAQAFDPYLELIADGQLADSVRASLKQRIYRRWAQALQPDQAIETLPPVVRLAIVEIAAQAGQNRSIEANGSTDQQEAAVLHAEAQKQLEKAIELGQSLLGDQIPQQIRAGAQYQLAVSQYWLAPGDPGNLMAVMDLLLGVAEQMWEQPLGEHAMAIGIDLARRLHVAVPRPVGADEVYRRAARLLFDRYSLSPAADNERVYYGYEIEQASGEYERAIESYDRVPRDHPTYFEGQREKLFCMRAIAERTEVVELGVIRQRVRSTVEEIASEAQNGMTHPDPQVVHTAHGAVAAGQIVLAGLAQIAGDSNEALTLLVGFEDRFPEQEVLCLDVMTQRTRILLSAERFEEATDAAQAMMQVFPEDASGVVDGLLSDLDAQIDALRSQAVTERVQNRKQQMLAQAQMLSKASLRLAEVLVEWARTQSFDDPQMLPFELVRVRAARLAGDPDLAIELAKPIFARFGDEVNMISEYADVLFALGSRHLDQGDRNQGEQKLIRAAAQYDRLITGLNEPYPPLYWNAWTCRLLINEKLGTYTEDIAFRVRQLKKTHPDLGGPAFRVELERLERRYAP